eukprot:scaffold19252_cov117-Isochrysis_galbana.AAC.2
MVGHVKLHGHGEESQHNHTISRKAQTTRKQCHTGSCIPLQTTADDTFARQSRPGHCQLERAGSVFHYLSTLFRRGKKPTADRARISL